MFPPPVVGFSLPEIDTASPMNYESHYDHEAHRRIREELESSLYALRERRVELQNRALRTPAFLDERPESYVGSDAYRQHTSEHQCLRVSTPSPF